LDRQDLINHLFSEGKEEANLCFIPQQLERHRIWDCEGQEFEVKRSLVELEIDPDVLQSHI
jgi:hypothetical protein